MQQKFLTLLVILGLAAGSASCGKLTLEEAQRIALEKNLSLQLAKLAVEQAHSRFSEAKAGLLPTIDASGSYTRIKEQPPVTIPGFGELPGLSSSPNNYSLQLSLTQPLYPGMSLKVLPKAAELQLEAAEQEYARALKDLKFQVASSFYNYLTAQELVKVTQNAIETAEKQLAIAQAFYEAGTVLKTDVLRAELAVGSLKQNLLAAENGAALARANLEAVLGVSLAGFTVEAPAAPEVLLTVNEEEALAIALQNRPEMAAAKIGLAQAELAVEMARAGKRPQVALVGNYGWQGSELDFEDLNWSLTLSARLPIFDGGAKNAAIEQAELGVRSAKLALEQLEQAIALELAAAVGSLKEAKGKLPYTERAVEQAQTNLRIAEARYREGVGMLTEVLEAQAAMRQAQVERIGAINNYYLAVEKLTSALGTEIPEAWEVVR